VDAPPSELTANAPSSDFRCQECGGRMLFDAVASHMVCEHCGATRKVGEAEGGRTIVEYDLEQGLARASQRGYGVAVRTIGCKECGSVVSFGESVTARACDFCGSAQVLEQAASRNVLRPESVVPFQIDRGAASQKFAAWIGGLWFRPSDLKRQARVQELTGMYVPYWSFDARVHSDWTAQAGYHYYVTETRTTRDAQGNTVTRDERVQKTRWERAWGSRDDVYDDHLICGSRGIPPELAGKLRTFDTGQLRSYDPGFLAGWKAEEYSVELNAAWQQAVAAIEAEQRSRCSRDVPGDTQRFLDVDNRFSGEKFKHVLLPIWIAAYRYHDRPFQFLVNGQTGEITGKAPWSWVKIALFTLAIAALIIGIIVLIQSRKS
jgi:predicted RNA-binding Zn-ribbon protein involved in translation (DUF1610 family)